MSRKSLYNRSSNLDSSLTCVISDACVQVNAQKAVDAATIQLIKAAIDLSSGSIQLTSGVIGAVQVQTKVYVCTCFMLLTGPGHRF